MPEILFPAGRMVGGNLDKTFPRTENDGKTPKIGRDGQPEMQCSFGFAIPKGPETHWNQTPWGKVVYDTGAAAHPALVASPAFSWKITDGDSTLPNKRGKRPCDQVGYAGHWVMWFSQGWLPKRVNANGTVELPEGSILPGYYIQVFGSVAGNKLVPNGTPGVYLNPIAVALAGEGDKITVDVDTTAVGFGGAPLPAGARPVQAAAPAFSGQPTPPVSPAAPPMPPGVQPAPDFLNPPVGAVAPPPAGPRMTPAATATREQYHAAGWTDAQLVQNGLMVM
jgi:hypothetical protein